MNTGPAASQDHDPHPGHSSGGSGPASLNRLALSATAHCFTGCTIGEVLGLLVSVALGWNAMASVAVAVFLAFVFGYSFTLIPLLRSGMTLVAALPLALASDTISIIVMELVDNEIMLVIPGAMSAGLTDSLFWGSLVVYTCPGICSCVSGEPMVDRRWTRPCGCSSASPRSLTV